MNCIIYEKEGPIKVIEEDKISKELLEYKVEWAHGPHMKPYQYAIDEKGHRVAMPGQQIRVPVQHAPYQNIITTAGRGQKRDMAQEISQNLGVPIKKAKEVMTHTFKGIMAQLFDTGKVELRGFGVFRIRRSKPRYARDPRNGARVFVGARSTVIFKPSKLIKQQLRQSEEGFA